MYEDSAPYAFPHQAKSGSRPLDPFFPNADLDNKEVEKTPLCDRGAGKTVEPESSPTTTEWPSESSTSRSSYPNPNRVRPLLAGLAQSDDQVQKGGLAGRIAQPALHTPRDVKTGVEDTDVNLQEAENTVSSPSVKKIGICIQPSEKQFLESSSTEKPSMFGSHQKLKIAAAQLLGEEYRITFRFIAYNMANRAEVQMDDVGSGFVNRRASQFTDNPEKSSEKVSISDVSEKCSHNQRSSAGSTNHPESSRQSTSSGTPKMSSDSRPSWARALRRSMARKLRVSFCDLMVVGAEMREETKESRASALSQDSTTYKRSRDKKTTALSFFGSRKTRRHQRNSVIASHASADCSFGVLCESKFHLDTFDVVQDAEGQLHSYAMSAKHMLSEVGVIAHSKGKVADKFGGDLKTVLLCRHEFKEVEGGKVFCSYDGSSQGVSKGNPMKSFLGQSFDMTNMPVRFIFLGTHFPMSKLGELMQDTTRSEDDLLQKMKCSVARLLQKILRHLMQRELLHKNTIVLLQGDLNSRCIRHEGKYVDLLTETLQDVRLQQFIASDLPPELQGEWREVVNEQDTGNLPVTYRFDQALSPSDLGNTSRLSLNQVYGGSAWSIEAGSMQESEMTYAQVLDRLRAHGTLEEWGLYSPKHSSQVDGNSAGSSKFKPSRLPACTERVLFYAPGNMLDSCKWETLRGYEVNYAQTGSDHKPVFLEATLTIKQGRKASTHSFDKNNTNSQVPDDFVKRYFDSADEEDDSDVSSIDSPTRLGLTSRIKTRLCSCSCCSCGRRGAAAAKTRSTSTKSSSSSKHSHQKTRMLTKKRTAFRLSLNGIDLNE